MPLLTIAPGDPDPRQAANFCARLEAGDLLYFPRSPIAIPEEDIAFLLNQQQTASGLHKNIAYKPPCKTKTGTITGMGKGAEGAASKERLRGIMQRYSGAVDQFLRDFLPPYGGRWKLDYASFRPQEEEGRDLPLRRRNDLLHTDAFPTRPTQGARILRFFNNLHPQRTRDWVVSDPFGAFVSRYAPSEIALPRPSRFPRKALRKLAAGTGLDRISPSLKRSPYDDFMMRFHNFLKENARFQADCTKYPQQFPPGSSWMVYTDMVPHAVLAGQYALEQTFLVDRRALVAPGQSPLAILEAMTHSSLV